VLRLLLAFNVTAEACVTLSNALPKHNVRPAGSPRNGAPGGGGGEGFTMRRGSAELVRVARPGLSSMSAATGRMATMGGVARLIQPGPAGWDLARLGIAHYDRVSTNTRSSAAASTAFTRSRTRAAAAPDRPHDDQRPGEAGSAAPISATGRSLVRAWAGRITHRPVISI